MDWKRLKKACWNKKYGLPIAFLLFVFFFGLFYLTIDFFQIQVLPSEGTETNCRIEYTHYKCFDGRAVIAFYNPNTYPISSVSVHIPVKSGTDIFNVSEPLASKVTGTITTAKCGDIAGRVFSLEWCCDNECHSTRMTKPSKSLSIS